jgi:phosphonoacetaldehyde hydrolase
MIFKVMELTNLYPTSSVLKIGDTIPDVMEGKNAGCITFSVLKTGPGWEGEASRKRLTSEFELVGTDRVIDSVADLPGVIENMWGY